MAVTVDDVRSIVGFPKAWRQAQVDAEPEKFSLPSEHDLRYHWLHVRLAAIDVDELRDLVEGAWALCAPKRVVEEYRASLGRQLTRAAARTPPPP